jgi:cobalt-zinc-cadmium efflux system outer membrane protein
VVAASYEPDPVDLDLEIVGPPEPLEDVPSAEGFDGRPLTLEGLQEWAIAGNPGLAEQAARLEALRGRWQQAGIWDNPQLGYTSQDVGTDGTAGQQGGFVQQTILAPSKRLLDQQILCWEIAVQQQRLATLEQRLRTDVKLAYYRLLVAQRKVALARELERVSLEAAAASQRLFDAMEIARVGVLQSEVEAENARLQVAQAENDLLAAWRQLATLVGQPELPLQAVRGELDEPDGGLVWSSELERVSASSPEVAQASAELEAARAALERTLVETRPDVQLQVSLQHDNVVGDTVSGVQVGLPVPLWNKQQGAIRAAQANLAAASHRMQRIELALASRLATAYQAYSNARSQVVSSQEKLLPQSRETFELVRQGFQRGEIGYLDQLFAQRTYFQTNLTYLGALGALWDARIRIEGLLLFESWAP